MQIVWTARAPDQFDAAYAYLAEESLPAAQRQDITILSAVEQLMDFPDMGRPGRVRRTRELIVHGTPYVVAYRRRRDRVSILALLHGARRWPSHL